MPSESNESTVIQHENNYKKFCHELRGLATNFFDNLLHRL